jgi:hypothetical protein
MTGERTTDWSRQWPTLYATGGEPSPYDDDATTYMRAGAFLSGPGLVEEWGCATTWGKRFVGAPYRGVDGAEGVDEFWGAVRADLRTYRSSVPKILMRHVLEHNWEWRAILQNALASFTDRMVLVLFIEPSDDGDFDVPGAAWDDGPNHPPGLMLDAADLTRLLDGSGARWTREDVIGGRCPPFNHEIMYFLDRGGA